MIAFDHYQVRFLTAIDLEDYFALIDNNRKRLENFFAGTVAMTKTLEDTKAHLVDALDKLAAKQYFPFVVIDDRNHAMIASIQLKNLDWTIPKGEIGYYIDSAYESKGIITKATGLIIDYCFNELGINKLFIRTHESNTGSRMVAEKNGFRLEGTLRRDYKTTGGTLVDSLYYGRLKEE